MLTNEKIICAKAQVASNLKHEVLSGSHIFLVYSNKRMKNSHNADKEAIFIRSAGFFHLIFSCITTFTKKYVY